MCMSAKVRVGGGEQVEFAGMIGGERMLDKLGICGAARASA